jgi:hypothetical protein
MNGQEIISGVFTGEDGYWLKGSRTERGTEEMETGRIIIVPLSR